MVKWIATKSNTEFFSGSSDGRAMWWDTRKLRKPTEILVFDLQTPNEQKIDRAIGIASGDYEANVGTKFMFGLENGIVISGSRKARTPAEKMALRFNAHFGPVLSVDRSGFNPKIFLTVGDCTARVWAEDTKDGCLVSTRYFFFFFQNETFEEIIKRTVKAVSNTNNFIKTLAIERYVYFHLITQYCIFVDIIMN